jgi:hypothetical protein
MNKKIRFCLPLTVCLLVSLQVGCAPEKRAEAGEDQAAEVLFLDSMASGWTENWFLDGKKATLEHRDGGLYFSGGTVTKADDPVEYHAHHAVLWTKREFEGDIRLSYRWTPVDADGFGAILIYLQAQGVGDEPFDRDISKWSEMREIPAMDKYFNNMNLISLSIRENVRCKRYPWFDRDGNPYEAGGLIEPMVEYGEPIVPGKEYRIVVEKRNPMVSLSITDAGTGKSLIDHAWDSSKIDPRMEPKLVTRGRIGLRHMATKQAIYKDIKIERL